MLWTENQQMLFRYQLAPPLIYGVLDERNSRHTFNVEVMGSNPIHAILCIGSESRHTQQNNFFGKMLSWKDDVEMVRFHQSVPSYYYYCVENRSSRLAYN